MRQVRPCCCGSPGQPRATHARLLFPCATLAGPLLAKKHLHNSYDRSSIAYVCSRRTFMAKTKLSKLELQIMDALWLRGRASIREIQQSFPEKTRPAYTTIQTTVYRLENKKSVRRVRKVSNFH